jgi:hypothetical protein
MLVHDLELDRMDGFDVRTLAQDVWLRLPRSRSSRKAILVLGMDRSGTSMVTHMLYTLGAALPRDLIGPGPGNPLGHWEPRALVAINDEILARLGRRWDDPRPPPDHWLDSRETQDDIQRIRAEIEQSYADAPLMVIKDPRLCRLLPLYTEALELLDIAPVVILQVRPVAEVAQSLIDRDDMPPGLSELLWLRSVTEAERYSRQCPRVWVSFTQVVADWRKTVDRIGDTLGVSWPIHPDDAAEEIGLLLNPRPRHIVPSSNGALMLAWETIQAGLAGDDLATRIAFDRVRASLQDADRLYIPALSHPLGRLEAEVEAMRASTCWRLTAPLRAIKRLLAGKPRGRRLWLGKSRG